MAVDFFVFLRFLCFPARRFGFAFVFFGDIGLTTDGARLPDPENVALAGAPKTAGCGAGAARHESAVVHAGGTAAAGEHGTAAEQTCASYTSNAVSESCGANCPSVTKNTSSPLALASKNVDAWSEDPEEIKPTQPPDDSLNVTLDAVQSPTPAGSYSYTSD